MQRHCWRLLLGVLLLGSWREARAFSLLGQFDTWQTVEIGYQLGADLGGPMNLGEEYRWNLPLLTYGFDESFLNYFGSKGAEEVEKAIAILNELPGMSTLSPELSEYPLDTRRFNHRANALFLYDLKSYVLATLLEQLGVAAPERYVWTLRSRVVINNIPVYTVIKRNFDPITSQPSAYVNGTLYTYQILQTYVGPDTWEAVEFDVDPSVLSVTSVAGYHIDAGTVLAGGIYTTFSPGLFYTGLTRDDVAALRYLYRPMNYNTETIATNAFLAPTGAEACNCLITQDTGGSPWGPPPGSTTNVVGTNALAVVQALRPGMDKVAFVRVDYDSQIGVWLTVTNRYVDYYITNSTLRSQIVDRVLAQPDILFTAEDLGIAPDGTPFVSGRTLGFVSQDAINGSTVLAGPGLITPPVNISFSKLGEYLINIGDGGETDGEVVFWWGSYDGTTNAPVVYPVGASIETVERLVLTGAVDDETSPWGPPPSTTTGGGTAGGTAGGTTSP